ncbi:trypsin-like peptidase domain-containing protein [Nocardioides sp.]|uniref:S1C family serine protease n=1 Tax=Nocardioides sp. TaxID=35761 RepID=UPI002623CE92|nr:trypsin-like peptidase domain-containing protein [Nocardioides sp.]
MSEQDRTEPSQPPEQQPERAPEARAEQPAPQQTGPTWGGRPTTEQAQVEQAQVEQPRAEQAREAQPPADWTSRTQPLPGVPAQAPGPWGQPYGQQPQPYPQQFPQPGAHAARTDVPTARVGGWVWPVVAVLALVVGVIGGVVGAAGFRILDEASEEPGLVSTGLDGVETREDAPLTAADGTIANVADALLPSTVQIIAEFGGDESGATGSGFVLDRQGHVVTNSHVVADADEDGGRIQVVDQEGNRYDAEVVGRSAVYDLAVLIAPEMAGEFEPSALGASTRLRVGETVVAIGSPLGLSSTVTAGIVSALDRPVTTGDPESTSYINAVQTDAAINPGNSGGPLVNLLGEVVGVNSAIATTGGFGRDAGNIGVGFAIPVEQVRITADQILRTGEAQYPVIGAEVRTGNDDGDGAEIQEVTAGSAAEEAGLQDGDVVTEVEGLRVTDGIALIVAIRTYQPGERVDFTVRRDGQERVVSIELRGQVG